MKLTFLSNYINHHQQPLCDALYRALGEDFRFVQTEPMARERQALGWDAGAAALPYVRLLYKEETACRRYLSESDVVLLGWVGDAREALAEEVLAPSLERGRPVFRLSERIYKTGQWKAVSPRGLAAKRRQHLRYRNAPVYLLCAGAYVASDYALFHAYPGRRYRWGYFPPFAPRDGAARERLLLPDDAAPPRPLSLVWAGRLISWKHPEFALRLAGTLRARGQGFTLTMAGDGRLRETLAAEARERGVADAVRFTGALPPGRVREVMAEGDIFLFTSNYLEGWGAVLNEAMSSGMAVVASAEAGATPYLIRDGENGLTYPGGQYAAFERAALSLIDGPTGQSRHSDPASPDPRQLAAAGYRTIAERWNAEVAAARLLAACEEALAGRIPTPAADDGPMSAAPILRPAGLLRTLSENRLAEGL